MADLLDGKAAVAHLLRRAGFGPSPETWPAFSKLTYEEALERVLADLDDPPAPDPDGFDPYVPGAIQQLWLERMLAAPIGLAEKLAFFWHGHFATSDAKINDPKLMWLQYQLLRTRGGGPFPKLVLGISRDVAMIRWLDGNSNRKGHANENYGRELQELFTLGIGNYTEEDIREISRAFTGWGSRHHEFIYRDQFHDDGEKTFHGRTGNFNGEEAVAIITALPACARYMAGKFLRFFSHPDPTETEIEKLAGVMRNANMDIKATLTALFSAPEFRSRAHHRVIVRSPVEFAIGALRTAGVHEIPSWIHGALDRMGQILFHPPSVKGWTSGSAWLSSGAVIERLRAAQRMAALVETPDPQALTDLLFQGDMPRTLPPTLLAEAGPGLLATILGGPEFQLI